MTSAGRDVFIYGSCVSRDAFSSDDAPVMVDYIARSSLGSAFSEPPPGAGTEDLSANSSAFQRRMVEADRGKHLASLLTTTAFDWLLVDFIDERLRLLRTPTGYVTFSPEAQRCGVPAPATDLVTPGSDEHLAAFGHGFERLLELVPENRIVINKVYWAKELTTGEPHADGGAIAHNNEILDRLYALVAGSGVRWIEYPSTALRTDPDHQWGPLPFHYCDEFYVRTREALAALPE